MATEADLQLLAAKRLLAAREAHDDLLKFMKLSMPDADDPEDPEKSRYEETPLARLLCQVMQKVERREQKRVCVSVGPQFGKSQIISRGFPAWVAGRNPYTNLILGTFNQPKADEEGDQVRDLMMAPAYRQIFETKLRKGGAAKDLLITNHGGRMAFVGRGGSGTGKPADFFIVDDPLKDDREAQSDATREEVWSWFNKVALTRCHSKSGIVIVHTRWNLDDLIGRMVDPDHPDRKKRYRDLEKRWKYYNLPAVVDDPKLAAALGLTLERPTDPNVISMFGSKPITSIWPGRKDLDLLAEAKQMDPAGFGALYMGKPSPDDGDYFKAEWMAEYDRHELPDNLRKYGASDHAVSLKQGRDPTVMGVVGVDEKDDIWVLPDLVWDQMETDRTVEELLRLMKEHAPQLWWMESENISKSFGPFLRKRMREEQVYITIDPVSVAVDKGTRARSIQGRMSMRKVHFPRFAHWWPDAKKEMLSFPNGAHDDFVDFMAHVGMGLLKEVRASTAPVKDVNMPQRVGTFEWIKKASDIRRRADDAKRKVAGW